MESELNNKIVSAIQKHYSEEGKLIPYLADLLCLSKESVYRRIGNKKPFTIKETCIVFSAMGLSFDEVIGGTRNSFFSIPKLINESSDFEERFKKMLLSQVSIAKQMHKAVMKETLTVLNRLSIIVHMDFKHIFKFLYFKHLHSAENIPYNFRLSDLIISPEIISLCKEIAYYSKPMENSTYIFDDNIIAGVIREIKYYYKRDLISNEELHLIQEDLHSALDQAERTFRSGNNDYGAKVYHYYSMFDLDSNYTYYDYDGNAISQFWIHQVHPVIISDPAISAVHKEWIESLKKYSTLVTLCNEAMQSEFMNKQRRLIINLTK